ncbi:LysE family translocator, partial [Salmonella enterica]|nr:LysE family translocator [Salmonella enterica]
IALPQIQGRLGNLVWKIERAAGGILIAFGCWIVWQFITS